MTGPTPDSFGRRDLVLAYLDCRRIGDKRAYSRYHAMASAFDLAPDDRPDIDLKPTEEWARRGYLQQLFAETVLRLERLGSPSVYLEAPRVLIHMHQRYGTRIQRALDEAEAAMVDLLDELAGRLWAIGDSERVTAVDLDAHGFDPSAYPAADDDW